MSEAIEPHGIVETHGDETALDKAETVAMEQPAQPFMTERLKESIREHYFAGASDAEFDLAVMTCERLQLDPFKKQIYFLPIRGKLQACPSIDGLRLVAKRTGRDEGKTKPQWCGEDGVWRDVWPSKKPPVAARRGVWARGNREPTWGVVHFEEFAKNSGNWPSMPRHMIAKCAEALALRTEYPYEMSGVYTDDEMEAHKDAPMKHAGSSGPEDTRAQYREQKRRQLPPRVVEAEPEYEQPELSEAAVRFIAQIEGTQTTMSLEEVAKDARAALGEGTHDRAMVGRAYHQRRKELAERERREDDEWLARETA